MARRVVSRKDKVAEAEAAEAEKSAKKKKKTKTAKRKTKAKPATEVRMKMYWGVFSQSLKRIAVFEYDQKSEAEKRAAELSKGGKSPHFVQKVKEEVGIE
ncbi:hypothetical protein [Roseimaritima sediminicola]|uniref:hypothetical protein n=1 Tax=Roseimaritima sediminicola TaxID=2662066 RepID=UPI0012982F1D|nr:hypothetical protein [Roseimaritima sediminicola]